MPLFPCSPQVTAFVEGLFVHSRDHKAYKSHVRDFLIDVLVSCCGSSWLAPSAPLARHDLLHSKRLTIGLPPPPLTLQEIKGTDEGGDLFAEEKVAAAAADDVRRRAVPGLQNPWDALPADYDATQLDDL